MLSILIISNLFFGQVVDDPHSATSTDQYGSYIIKHNSKVDRGHIEKEDGSQIIDLSNSFTFNESIKTKRSAIWYDKTKLDPNAKKMSTDTEWRQQRFTFDSEYLTPISQHFPIQYKGYTSASADDIYIEKNFLEKVWPKALINLKKRFSNAFKYPIIAIYGSVKFLIQADQLMFFFSSHLRCPQCWTIEKVNAQNWDHVVGLSILNFAQQKGILPEKVKYNTVLTYNASKFQGSESISTLYARYGNQLPDSLFLNPKMIPGVIYLGSTIIDMPIDLKRTKEPKKIAQWIIDRMHTDSPEWIGAMMKHLKGETPEDFLQKYKYLPGDRSTIDMQYTVDLRTDIWNDEEWKQHHVLEQWGYDYSENKGYGPHGGYTIETQNMYMQEMINIFNETKSMNRQVDNWLGIDSGNKYDGWFNYAWKVKKNQDDVNFGFEIEHKK